MTTILICLLLGALIPYALAFSSLPFRSKQFGSPDLNEPRAQGNQLTDAGGRVVAAQANAWEALAVFTVANVAAFMAGVDPAGNWSIAAMVWVVGRIGHGVFYTMGNAPLRVLSFLLGVGTSIWIFVMAITA